MAERISAYTARTETTQDTDLLDVSIDTSGGNSTTFATRKETRAQLRDYFMQAISLSQSDQVLTSNRIVSLNTNTLDFTQLVSDVTHNPLSINTNSDLFANQISAFRTGIVQINENKGSAELLTPEVLKVNGGMFTRTTGGTSGTYSVIGNSPNRIGNSELTVNGYMATSLGIGVLGSGAINNTAITMPLNQKAVVGGGRTMLEQVSGVTTLGGWTSYAQVASNSQLDSVQFGHFNTYFSELRVNAQPVPSMAHLAREAAQMVNAQYWDTITNSSVKLDHRVAHTPYIDHSGNSRVVHSTQGVNNLELTNTGLVGIGTTDVVANLTTPEALQVAGGAYINHGTGDFSVIGNNPSQYGTNELTIRGGFAVAGTATFDPLGESSAVIIPAGKRLYLGDNFITGGATGFETYGDSIDFRHISGWSTFKTNTGVVQLGNRPSSSTSQNAQVSTTLRVNASVWNGTSAEERSLEVVATPIGDGVGNLASEVNVKFNNIVVMKISDTGDIELPNVTTTVPTSSRTIYEDDNGFLKITA